MDSSKKVAKGIKKEEMQMNANKIKITCYEEVFDLLLFNDGLSEEFLEKHFPKIVEMWDTDLVFEYQTLSEAFLRRHVDSIPWGTLFQNPKACFSADFIMECAEKVAEGAWPFLYSRPESKELDWDALKERVPAVAELEEAKKTQFIHYGHNKYDEGNFRYIESQTGWTKPIGGLWASPVGTEFGWADWCTQEQFDDCDLEKSFKFFLVPWAKVLTINSVDDLAGLPRTIREGESRYCCLDFEYILEDDDWRYDAIAVNISADRDLYYELYGWDCDSLLVLNEEVVVPIFGEEE